MFIQDRKYIGNTGQLPVKLGCILIEYQYVQNSVKSSVEKPFKDQSYNLNGIVKGLGVRYYPEA